jgi:hypothetical protein
MLQNWQNLAMNLKCCHGTRYILLSPKVCNYLGGKIFPLFIKLQSYYHVHINPPEGPILRPAENNTHTKMPNFHFYINISTTPTSPLRLQSSWMRCHVLWYAGTNNSAECVPQYSGYRFLYPRDAWNSFSSTLYGITSQKTIILTFSINSLIHSLCSLSYGRSTASSKSSSSQSVI